MSPHGDLIAFGFFALAVATPVVWYCLYLAWSAVRERRRHNRAVERHNWRLYWQIRRLGECDGSDDGGRS